MIRRNIFALIAIAIISISCDDNNSPTYSVKSDPNPTQIIFFGINGINANSKTITTNHALKETVWCQLTAFDKDRFDTVTTLKDGVILYTIHGMNDDTLNIPIVLHYADSLYLGRTIEYKYVMSDKLGFISVVTLNTIIVR